MLVVASVCVMKAIGASHATRRAHVLVMVSSDACAHISTFVVSSTAIVNLNMLLWHAGGCSASGACVCDYGYHGVTCGSVCAGGPASICSVRAAGIHVYFFVLHTL